MKELSVEEKAKRYDEAFGMSKSWYIDAQIDFKKSLETLFPELKENENEKIRKAIIECVKNYGPSSANPKLFKNMLAWLEKQDYTFEIKEGHWYKCVCDYMLDSSNLMFKNGRLYYCRSDWRLSGEIDERNVKDIGVNGYKSFFRPATNQEIEDWLEKLGEKKPADKVEPKFHEGDWVVSPNGVYWHIDKISNNRYEVTSNTGESSDWPLDTNIYHRFSIQDAKDGDVLCVNDGMPFIFTGKQGDVAYWGLNSFGKFVLTTVEWSVKTSVLPATKEQRDLLFQKIEEAGYEWDSGRKELKKHTPKHKVGDTIYYNSFGEVKSMIVANVTTDGTDNPMYEDENGNAVFEKDLIEQTWSKPGHKQGWSEEDEKKINSIIETIRIRKFEHPQLAPVYEGDINWLKSLKERVQPKQEWSKEDEKYWSIVIAEFSKCAGKSVSKDEWMRCNDWLNSLRDRVQPVQRWSALDERNLQGIIDEIEANKNQAPDYDIRTYDRFLNWLNSLRPQAQWKPSDKQMKVLWKYAEQNNYNGMILTSLYNDLKKL